MACILSLRLEHFRRECPHHQGLGMPSQWVAGITDALCPSGAARWEPAGASPSTARPTHPPGPPSLSPSGSWGSGPRAVQRVLCLGWKQLFSPLWKHGLCLIIKLSEAGSKGTTAQGAGDYGAVLRAAHSLSSAPNPYLSRAPENTLSPLGWAWVHLGAQGSGQRPTRAETHPVLVGLSPSSHPGLSLQPCQRGIGCERAERH